MAKADPRWWTGWEDFRLRKFAPMGMEELLRHLAPRSRDAIKQRAIRLKVKITRTHWHGGEARWRGRLPIPPHAHPLVRRFFRELNREQTLLSEVAARSGVSSFTMSDWRNRRSPLLTTFIAALNVVGLDLSIVPLREQGVESVGNSHKNLSRTSENARISP